MSSTQPDPAPRAPDPARANPGPADPRRGAGISERALDFLFSPRTVAVIGATDREGSVGRAVLQNLASFKGEVYPVNPAHATLLGRPSYRQVSAVPARVDLAVIATPAETVPGIVGECARAGVRGAVILSAGFKEVGPAGAALERRILEEAAPAGLRIVGPNCLGVMVPPRGLNASFAAAAALRGNIAFISQSGALCSAILGWSIRKNLGFSAFVSVGSMLDVGWGDLISHLGDDPHTQSIVIYMESVGDARSFLSAARQVAFTKPVIVIKVGRSEAAARAAASHTGSLTGSDDVLDAALRRVGVLRVDTIGDLFEIADLVAKQPLPRGPRLTVVTNAGGPGALAVDMLVGSGGQVAPLSGETIAALDAALPPAWSRGNPIDILGDADPERYAKAVELALREPASDGVLAVLTPQAVTDPTGTAARLAPFAKGGSKPVLASWMGGAEVDAGRQLLTDAGMPVFEYPDAGARAFSLMWQRRANLLSLYETPALSASEAGHAARERAEAVLASARKAGRTLLSEHEAKQVIAAYGIPVVETRVALSQTEAAVAAQKLGFPVAVKLHSESLSHKSDVGGVHLNVEGAEGVRQAWRAIEKSVGERAGREHFLGVTVQRMVRRDGCELILGSSADPQFGPVILFGAGGELVEVLRDRALALPPLTTNLARLLMERTRIHAALRGVRGHPAVDLLALEQLLVRFSQLVAEHPRIKEVDINPLVVSASQMVALDARIIVHEAAVSDAQLPRLAIRPYPFQYVRAATLKDGTGIAVRPIRPEDEPLMVKFHRLLSPTSVYSRYFEFLQYEQRIGHERLARLSFIDYDREMALVAEHRTRGDGGREIIGVGRLIKLPGTHSAEFAIVVGDPWQNRGLGRLLLDLLVRFGRDERLGRITGDILPDNAAMKHVARSLGFRIRALPGESTVRAEIDL